MASLRRRYVLGSWVYDAVSEVVALLLSGASVCFGCCSGSAATECG